MRGGYSRGRVFYCVSDRRFAQHKPNPHLASSATCSCVIPWFDWIYVSAHSRLSAPAPISAHPSQLRSARPHRGARSAHAPYVTAARRRGGHGRLPVLPAGLLPLRGALLERAPPRRRGPPRDCPGPRYPHRAGTGREGGLDTGLPAPERSVRPLPAGAPERSGPGASRPGLSAAVSGSALAELSSGEGSGARVL